MIAKEELWIETAEIAPHTSDPILLIQDTVLPTSAQTIRMWTQFVLNLSNFTKEDTQSDIKVSLLLFIAWVMTQMEFVKDAATSDIRIPKLNSTYATHITA